MLYHIIHYVMLCYVTLHHIILYYTILYYIILCHSKSNTRAKQTSLQALNHSQIDRCIWNYQTGHECPRIGER